MTAKFTLSIEKLRQCIEIQTQTISIKTNHYKIIIFAPLQIQNLFK